MKHLQTHTSSEHQTAPLPEQSTCPQQRARKRTRISIRLRYLPCELWRQDSCRKLLDFIILQASMTNYFQKLLLIQWKQDFYRQYQKEQKSQFNRVQTLHFLFLKTIAAMTWQSSMPARLAAMSATRYESPRQAAASLSAAQAAQDSHAGAAPGSAA